MQHRLTHTTRRADMPEKPLAILCSAALTLSLFGVPASAGASEATASSGQIESKAEPGLDANGGEVSSALPVADDTATQDEAPSTTDTDDAQDTQPDDEGVATEVIETEDESIEEDPAAEGETTEEVASTSPEETSVQPAIDEGTFILRSSLSGQLVMDKAGGIKANQGSGNAQLWNSNGSAAQQVSISYDSNGYATIGLSDGTVLDVAGGKVSKAADVRWWRSNGTIAQKWVLTTNDDGGITIHPALDQSLCLDVQGGSATNGANLRLWSSNMSMAQRFVAVPFAGAAQTSNVSLGGKIVEIASALGGNLVMDVTSGSTASGAKMQLWRRNGSLAQAWRLEEQSNGYYVIRPTHSRAALGAGAGAVLPGTSATQQALSSAGASSTQLWSIRLQDDGSYSILAANSGLALEVAEGAASSGTALQLGHSNESTAQRWNLTVLNEASASAAAALGPGTYRLESAQTTATLDTPALVADVASGSTANGANVRLWSSNSSVAQQFRAQVGSDGKTITFVGTSSLKALDVASASPWPLANVQIYRSNNSAAQHWYAYANADGTYSLRSLSSGLALDAAGSAKGSNLRTNLPSSNATQRFRLVKVGDMRAFSDMLNAGKVKSIRIVGDSISDGVGLPGYSTAPRGTAIAYKNGDTIRYESSLTLATYSNAFRKYATSHGVKSFVTAGISGWKMSQFAANPDAWLQGGADVVVVALGVNDARQGADIDSFRTSARKALAAAAKQSKMVIVITEPCGATTPTPMRQIDAVLREVCAENGYVHVSLLGSLYSTTTYYNGDMIHPTEAGQSLLWWSLSKQLCLS